jgi:hypothetical protein
VVRSQRQVAFPEYDIRRTPTAQFEFFPVSRKAKLVVPGRESVPLQLQVLRDLGVEAEEPPGYHPVVAVIPEGSENRLGEARGRRVGAIGELEQCGCAADRAGEENAFAPDPGLAPRESLGAEAMQSRAPPLRHYPFPTLDPSRVTKLAGEPLQMTLRGKLSGKPLPLQLESRTPPIIKPEVKGSEVAHLPVGGHVQTNSVPAQRFPTGSGLNRHSKPSRGSSV